MKLLLETDEVRRDLEPQFLSGPRLDEIITISCVKYKVTHVISHTVVKGTDHKSTVILKKIC